MRVNHYLQRVPTCFMTLVTSYELTPGLSAHTSRYRDLSPTSPRILMFWNVLESFDQAQLLLFLRFVSGRSRLSAKFESATQKFYVVNFSGVSAL